MNKFNSPSWTAASFYPFLASLITSLLAAGSLLWWLSREPAIHKQIIKHTAGLDGVKEGDRGQTAEVNIGEFFKRFQPEPQFSLEGTWPQFRGADSGNILKGGPTLSDKWQDTPPILWQATLGEGYAGPVIYKGKVYILDYLEKEKADSLRSFTLTTGEEIWRRWYHIDIKRNHGRSRTVPAVDEDHIITMGPLGQVMSVDRLSGDLKWSVDLVKTYQSEIPQWYTGQCPLLEKGETIIAPAGPSALLVGFDAATGKVNWQTPNPHGWKMSHSSVMPMTLLGTKMYIYAALGGVVGVSAEEKNKGQILWKSNHFSPSVVAPSPVKIAEDTIYLTAGYGAGSTTLQITRDQNGFQVIPGKRFKPRQALSMEQQSAILYQDILFGVMPKDAGSLRSQFLGSNPRDLTDFVVRADTSWRFGLCPFIIADDKFYTLDPKGQLSMMRLINNELQLLDQAKILVHGDPWGPIAIADGIMVIRDAETLVAIDLTADQKWKRKP